MKLMYIFLHQGIIMNFTAMSICSDDEYIGKYLVRLPLNFDLQSSYVMYTFIGATLGFAQELSRYAVGRAGEVDTFLSILIFEYILTWYTVNRVMQIQFKYVKML